jgi:sugar/nucleoside kinase (ribokinase family)
MGILVVGSVALDSIKTSAGSQDDVLGGSATYFSVSASYFAPVSVIAVVGEDFPEEHVSFLSKKGIDTSGLQRQKGTTFRWKGEYSADMNTATTLETQLNVFADFSPQMMDAHRNHECLFLGNIDPDLQRLVLQQMKKPRVIACDTMNYWINHKRESLLKTLALIDILVINDAETRQLAEEINLLKAAHRILSWGPKTLVVKRGEYGALMVTSKAMFGVPAYPLEEVVDPTGAGDSFAGGFMGFLAASGASDDAALRKAVVCGSVMASFNVSEFGPRRLGDLTYPEIKARFQDFHRLTAFEHI